MHGWFSLGYLTATFGPPVERRRPQALVTKGEMMSKQGRGYALVMLAGTLWGLNGLFVNALGSFGLEPLLISLARYGCATVLLMPLLLAKGLRTSENLFAIRPQHLALCCTIGVLTNTVAFSAGCVATRELGMTSAAVLLYTAPVYGCVLARVLYHERMTAQKLLACLLNFAGVVMVVSGGDVLALARGGMSLQGIAAGLIHALLFALVAPLNKPMADKCSPFTVVFWSLASATLSGVVLSLATGTSLAPLFAPRTLLCSLAFAMTASVIASLLYTLGLSMDLEVSRVPVMSSVEVAASALAGTLVLGEPFGSGQALGIAGVMASIGVMNLRAERGQVIGVHVLPSVSQLQMAYQMGTDMNQAVNNLREQRERLIHDL